ncbi:hypothetical protein SAMN05444392_11150 [Seinonella peptonophila]|uniref:Uncharacterized protein n=1 Tax=Seinonella peptonophila TaxID=112248 RepID=A0A1M4ZZE9_9BACL|nr:hypothetical protein [Seinonella peptonophila]SHF23092.1 hypothetical protein SAMN05444392_11150 [Seinonella peptonophila]
MALNIGEIGFTLGVMKLVDDDITILVPLIERHRMGDWGDVPFDDKVANDFEVRGACGGGFLSSYQVNGTKIWISTVGYGTTEVYTVVMLPNEY